MTEELVIPISCTAVKKVEYLVAWVCVLAEFFILGGLIGFVGRMMYPITWYSIAFGMIMIPALFLTSCWMALGLCDVNVRCAREEKK